MRTTLHVESRVHDFETWKSVFDKFDRFRADHHVRSYRLHRDAEDPHRVTVDLTFDSASEATAFRGALEKVWASPQSRAQTVGAHTATILELMEDRTL